MKLPVVVVDNLGGQRVMVRFPLDLTVKNQAQVKRLLEVVELATTWQPSE